MSGERGEGGRLLLPCRAWIHHRIDPSIRQEENTRPRTLLSILRHLLIYSCFVKITMFDYYAHSRLFVGHNFTQTREILIRFLGICLHFVCCRETLNINKRPTRAGAKGFCFQFPAPLLHTHTHTHNARVSTYYIIGRMGNLNGAKKVEPFHPALKHRSGFKRYVRVFPT